MNDETSADTCRELESAYCSDACPFHFDIIAFTEKLRRGSINAAYRQLREAVVYPEIVSLLCGQPCRDKCIRCDIDSSVKLNELERATINLTANHAPTEYNILPKKARIAIVGAGPSGLACMSRLSAKGYPVTVFEQSGEIGGFLKTEMPGEVFLREFAQQHQYLDFSLKLNHRIGSIDKLNEYRAIYIATGRGGMDFGQLPETINAQTDKPDQYPIACLMPGIFAGGRLLGADSVTAIASGIQAANAIEYFIKTDKVFINYRDRSRLCPDPMRIQSIVPQLPSTGAILTKEAVIFEASRCIKCQCDSCKYYCEMLTAENKSMKRVHDEAAMAAKPTSIDGKAAQGRRMVASCSQCNLCKKACPENISIGAMMLNSRRAIQRSGTMPWVFYEYWLRWMEYVNSPEISFTINPTGTGTRYLFFPGCQLSGAEPQAVTAAFSALKKLNPHCGLHMGCCGAPALWSGKQELFEQRIDQLRAMWIAWGKPTVIFACPGCRRLFAEHFQSVPSISLAEYLWQNGFESKRKGNGVSLAVFDPCAARNFPGEREAVRNLTQCAGFQLTELSNRGERAQCCGFGGHIYPANPPLLRSIVERRASQSNQNYLTYCSNCRDFFLAFNKKNSYLLDILFDLSEAALLSPTERWRNLLTLRAEMQGAQSGMTVQRPQTQITFRNDARKHAAEDLMLEDDIANIVCEAETTGAKTIDTQTNHCFASKMIGHYTCWVEYSVNGKQAQVLDVYCHRMNIVK